MRAHRPGRMAALTAATVSGALLAAACGTATVDDAVGAGAERPRVAAMALRERDTTRPTGSTTTTATSALGDPAAPPPPSAPEAEPAAPPGVASGIPPVGGLAPPVNIYAETTAGKLAPAVAGLAPRVYVPNSGEGTVSVIDPATFRVTETIRVDRGPAHVVPSWDLRTLWVVSTAGDTVLGIDPATGRTGTKASVADPYDVYHTPDGALAVVVSPRYQRLDLYDPLTWQKRGSIPVPHPGVAHGDLSENGRFFYASCEQSGWVVKVDLLEQRVVAEAHVGGRPVDVRLSPDTTVLYVADQGRDGVALLDPADLREVAFLATGRGAHGLLLSRDTTRLYVSNQLEGSVTVVDLAERAVVDTWRAPGGSPGTGGVSADGAQLWLAGRYHDEVYVFDTATGDLVRRISVGARPHSLTYFPQPGRFSLGHTGLQR